MANKEVVYRDSFPFLSILTLLFITLKLTGTITWSWIWILSPLWIPIMVILAIVVFCFVMAFLTGQL